MALSVNELLIAIDEMEIYKKDYDIIQTLLNSGDDEFFVKMLEEVINGNLYWSDFEHNLANTNYPDVLRQQLKTQKELNDTVRKLVLLRRNINPNYVYANEGSSLGIVKQYSENGTEVDIQNFYDQEMETIRGNILYDLTSAKPDDTILETAFKTRIYNAIRNGELVLNYNKNNKRTDITKTENEFGDEIVINGNKFTITDTEILIGDATYKEVKEPKNEEVWSYYERNDYDENKHSNITRYSYNAENLNYQTNISGNSVFLPTNDVQLEWVETTSSDFENEEFKENLEYYTIGANGGYYVKVDKKEGPVANTVYYRIKPYYRMTQNKHEYINPNDIFLHIQNYIIPIHADYQILDAFDLAYMKEHNIEEDHMRQIKMISMEMRRDSFVDEEKKKQQGG